MGFITGVTASSLLTLITLTSALSIPDNANHSTNGIVRFPLKKIKATDRSYLKGTVPASITNAQDNFYAIEIYVGSQNSPVSVIVDSGSSDLVVGTDYYNASASSTSKNLDTQGTDWHLNFTYYTDDVTAAGVTTNVEFATTEGNFALLGIGPLKSESNAAYNNFPYALAASNYISKPAFSVYLENEEATEENLGLNITNSEIIFGGIDHAKYTGELVSFPIISTDWAAIQLDTIKFADGSVYEINAPVGIDTGTTTGFLPQALMEEIAEIFGPYDENGSIINYNESWAETNFKFEFGSKIIEVPYTSFLTADQAGGWTLWEVYSPDDGILILGDIIIRNIYSVFDYEKNTILIAQSVRNAYGGPSNITIIP